MLTGRLAGVVCRWDVVTGWYGKEVVGYVLETWPYPLGHTVQTQWSLQKIQTLKAQSPGLYRSDLGETSQ